MSWWNNMQNQSFLSSYQDAARRLEELRLAQAANDNDSWYGRDDVANDFENALKAQQGQAVAGSALAGLNGLTGIVTASTNLAGIADTSMYQNQIDDIGRIGMTNYNSFHQLASDYGRLGTSQPNFTYEDVRGKTDGEIAGGILSSGLSGASAGYQIAGGIGALTGGIIGLGGGILGWLDGDARAENEHRRLKQNAAAANYDATINLQAATERMQDREHRYRMSNIAAGGGQLAKRSMTIREFASKVLKKPTRSDERPMGTITRQYCNGGVKIRIKR